MSVRVLGIKDQFVDRVRLRKKMNSIRAEWKTPVRPGDLLRLFSGLRTKRCKFIYEALVVHVERVIIHDDCVEFPNGPSDILKLRNLFLGNKIKSPWALKEFARLDGFEEWSDMVKFFLHRKHKKVTQFKGVFIDWIWHKDGKTT